MEKFEARRAGRSTDVQRGGSDIVSRLDIEAGLLNSPEGFFGSRRSVRRYSRGPVPASTVRRAVQLALRSPSVCNRQAWHVYLLNSSESRQAALHLQNGNSGFGHEIDNLVAVAADLRAFDTSGERNQMWIDGGMFSMSLVWAFHSLGIASCCLNWSVRPSKDKRLRDALAIQPNHSVLMFIAFGYPLELNEVCRSERRPLDEVLSVIS